MLSEFHSIVGKPIFFVSKAIPWSRAFNRRFYNAMIYLNKPYNHIRINNFMRHDVFTWLHFLESFNGVVYFPDRQWTITNTLQLFTDSVGATDLGCSGCYFQWEMGLFTMARSLDEHSNVAGYHFPWTSSNCFSILHMVQDAE